MYKLGLLLLVLSAHAATIDRIFSRNLPIPTASATFTYNSDAGGLVRTNFVSTTRDVNFAFTRLNIPVGSTIQSATLEIAFESWPYVWSPRFPQTVVPIDPNLPYSPAELFDEYESGHVLFDLQAVITDRETVPVNLDKDNLFHHVFNLLEMPLQLPGRDAVGFRSTWGFGDAEFYPIIFTDGVNSISTFDAEPRLVNGVIYAEVKVEYTLPNPEPGTWGLMALGLAGFAMVAMKARCKPWVVKPEKAQTR